ncbi:MAG: PIN domain-containing protein [Methylobacter sp.]
MTDKVFVDTNIWVYAYLDTDNTQSHNKHLKAVECLQQLYRDVEIIISTQVLSEYYSALLKNNISDLDIQESSQQLTQAIEVVALSKNTVINSYLIRNCYRYSYWDSLIIASALEHGCTKLISEDMQNHQLINGQLTINNPFLN